MLKRIGFILSLRKIEEYEARKIAIASLILVQAMRQAINESEEFSRSSGNCRGFSRDRCRWPLGR